MTPGQIRRRNELDEMIALYESAEQPTLERIAARFGVSRQAVHERLRRAGAALRKTGKRKIRIGRDVLTELYTGQKLTIERTAEELGVSSHVVRRELERHRIAVRRRGRANRKYKYLDDLQIGETVVIARPEVEYHHPALHGAAFRRRIRIRIRTVDEKTVRVTRIA